MNNSTNFPSLKEMREDLDGIRKGNGEGNNKNLFSLKDIMSVMDETMSGPCKALMSEEEYTCFAHTCIDKLMDIAIRKLMAKALELTNEFILEKHGKQG